MDILDPEVRQFLQRVKSTSPGLLPTIEPPRVIIVGEPGGMPLVVTRPLSRAEWEKKWGSVTTTGAPPQPPPPPAERPPPPLADPSPLGTPGVLLRKTPPRPGSERERQDPRRPRR